MEVTNGKAQLGGRAERLEEKYFYSVGGEYISGGFRKKTAVITAVVSNGDADLLPGEGAIEVVGKALGGHADSVFIYAVGTHSHDAAQTAGTKFEVTVKTLYQLVGVF